MLTIKIMLVGLMFMILGAAHVKTMTTFEEAVFSTGMLAVFIGVAFSDKKENRP